MVVHKFFIMLFLILIACTQATAQEDKKSSIEHDKWLKNLFSKQHEELIPKVAVADMFFACNLEHKQEFGRKTLQELIQKVSKERLAEKLSACLNGKSVKSDKAINYALLGCFHDQLDELPLEEKHQKIKLVKQVISSLPIEEKKKSLSQCVNDQTISYLK